MALVLALLVLLTVSGLALALLSLSALEPRIAKNLGDAARARWLAEAGVEIGFTTLVATADADDSWTGLLAGTTPAAPWVALPGLEGTPLPGLSLADGVYTVSLRNDWGAEDPALTGEGAGARDANGVVILRSTGVSSAATRTIEVVVTRRHAPGAPAVGVRALHAMSNWRER